MVPAWLTWAIASPSEVKCLVLGLVGSVLGRRSGGGPARCSRIAAPNSGGMHRGAGIGGEARAGLGENGIGGGGGMMSGGNSTPRLLEKLTGAGAPAGSPETFGGAGSTSSMGEVLSGSCFRIERPGRRSGSKTLLLERR
jgi:hypothetical protein